MSRIHDALRRGQRSAAAAAEPHKAAKADAVPALLGYRSERRVVEAPMRFSLVAVAAFAAFVAWHYWPERLESSPLQTSAPTVARVNPAAPIHATGSASPAAAPRTDVARAPSVPATVARPSAETATARSAVARGVRSATPALVPADFRLALYYQRTGDFEQALVLYRKVLQRDELNMEAHNNLGLLYQGKGLYDDASREFQKVIAIDPRYVAAHLNLSAASLKLGRLDAAAAEARAVLAIEPRRSDAYVNLALAQDAAGQAGEAASSLRRALEIDPHHAAAHYNLAQAYEKGGEPALAVDHYRQFLQYAGTDHAAYVADVRARIQALTRGNK